MNGDHKFYEMQSALSTTGHLTALELEELEQHVSQCVACRNCMVEMALVSRELFLTQAPQGNIKMPKGMQQRFLERVIAAGIPMKLQTTAAFDLRFARVIAASIVLALFISLGWQVFCANNAERTPGEPPPQMRATVEAGPHTRWRSSVDRAGQGAPVGHAKTKRRAAVRRTFEDSSLVRERNLPHAYPELSKSSLASQAREFSYPSAFWSESFAKSHLPTGVRTISLPPIPAEGAATLFARKWNIKPNRSFHLEFKLASLSQPQPFWGPSATPVPRFSTPVFHLDPSRGW